MDNAGTRLELDYFHQKVNVWVAEQQQFPSHPPKNQVSTVLRDNCKKSSANHSKETPTLLNCLNFSTIFSPSSYCGYYGFSLSRDLTRLHDQRFM